MVQVVIFRPDGGFSLGRRNCLIGIAILCTLQFTKTKYKNGMIHVRNSEINYPPQKKPILNLLLSDTQ